MTEALAQALADKLAAALPFLAAADGGRAVGLARLYTYSAPNGDDTVTVKVPVPVTFTADDCQRDPRYLVPDGRTPAILFFQDGGSQPLSNQQFPPSAGFRTASLTALLWVNTPLLTGPLDEVALLAAISQALRPGERQTLGDLSDVLLTYRTLPAETSLFGRYSYDTVTPLLLPPCRVLGLDITAQFRVNLKCLPATLPGVNPAYVPC